MQISSFNNNRINILNNFQITDNGKILYKKRSFLYNISGIILILFIISLLYTCNLNGYWIPGIACIFSVIIIYSTYTGGALVGLICTSLILCYYLTIFKIPLTPFYGKHHIMKNAFVNIINLYIIAIVSAIINKKFKLYMNQLLINQECISKAEELSMISIIYTSTDGKILKTNSSLCKLLGYTELELNSLNFKKLTYQEDWAIDTMYFEKLLRGDINSFEREERFIKKDGKNIWVYINHSLIRDENGKPFQILTYIHDITSKKHTEIALQESNEKYRKLVELLPDSILVHMDNKITYCNSSSVKFFGFNNKSDLIDTDINNLVHEDFKEIVKHRIQSIQKEGTFIPTLEEKLLSKDGRILYAEISGTPISVKNKIACLLVIRDISSRKNSEERQRLLNEEITYEKLKTEFFSNLSHELRTPLNVLLGSVQLLEMYINKTSINSSNIPLSRHIISMKQNCFRLLKLINNLIDITKINAGNYKLNLKNADIVSTVENISLSVSDYIANHGLDIIFDTNIEEKIIAFDPDNIERIMLNLISNSIKFSNKKGKIFISLYDMQDRIHISVRDTGIGISKDKHRIIFEPFRQVDKSFTRDNEGSGVGLAIVKSLVEMHKGRIWVNSALGQGSEFIIEIPSIILNEDNSFENNKIARSKSELINIEFSDIY